MRADGYPRVAVTAVAALYAATAAALAFVAVFAAAAWWSATPAAKLESGALVIAIAAAAVLARTALWPAAQRPAAQVFRYIIWLPILIGGPVGLAVLGVWWSSVTLFLMPRAPGSSAAGSRPGLPMDRERHPRLAALVAEAAQAAGIACAPTIWLNLSPTVQAEVIGGAPRAVLGLYALALLDEAQLRALLTHEFAHATGGRFERAAHRLHERCYRLLGRPPQLDVGAYLFFPRLAFGLRWTLAAARAHEARADRIAVGPAGGDASSDAALWSGRLQLAVAGSAQGIYHQQVLGPVLMLGHRPGLVEGLRHWLASPEATAAVAAAQQETAPALAPRFAAHPPRSEATAQLAFSLPSETDCALACLDAPWRLEEQLLQSLGLHFKPVTWEGVARELYLSNWEQVLSEHGDSLRGWTPRRVPELCRDLDALGRRLLKDEAKNFMPAYRVRMAETVLGISLAMCVQRNGWRVYDLPGQPLWLERREQRIEPFALVAGLQAGRTSEQSFFDECAQAGILDSDLSGAPAAGRT